MPIQKPMLTEDQQFIFEKSGVLPGMINSRTTAAIIGIRDHYIGLLVRERILQPLADPGTDYHFDQETIRALAKDRNTLVKIRRAIVKFNASQNER